jgi:hypothetical protein
MSIWKTGEDRHISIKHLLRAFARTDPAPNRVWPINSTILETLVDMPRPTKFSLYQWEALKDMAVLGFFYLLRPGEYAASNSRAKDHDTLGKPFKLKHTAFLLKNKKFKYGHDLLPRGKKLCNDWKPESMKMAMLEFNNQKSTARGDKLSHSYRGGKLCPGTALYNRVYALVDHQGKATRHPAGIDAPLHAYFVPAAGRSKARWDDVTTAQLTEALRLAAKRCEHLTGIPPKSINARSLHTGGATALLCAGVSKDITKILGRWRSDAVDLYLCTSTYTLTAGYSDRMVAAGNYQFTPEQATSSLPHLLPKEATPVQQDEYIGQLMIYNDDVDAFQDDEEGLLKPKGRPKSS